jgi:hypothetical protein
MGSRSKSHGRSFRRPIFGPSRENSGTGRRLLALALLLERHPRDGAASANGMNPQTLPNWAL